MSFISYKLAEILLIYCNHVKCDGYHGKRGVAPSGNEFFLGNIFFSDSVDPNEHFGTRHILSWGGGGGKGNPMPNNRPKRSIAFMDRTFRTCR